MNHMGEPQSLGERLRHVRGQCGLSLEAVAERAEVSKSFLWEVENDRSGISGERRQALPVDAPMFRQVVFAARCRW